MNFDTSWLLNFGSGRISRLATTLRLGMASSVSSWLLVLWVGDQPAFAASLRTSSGLLAILHALGVEAAAHDVIAHAGQVLDAAAANEHDGVFLEVVAFAPDVRNDLETVRQPHFRDFAQRRVRFLRVVV